MEKFKKEYYLSNADDKKVEELEAKIKELKQKYNITSDIQLSFGWGTGCIIEFDYKK